MSSYCLHFAFLVKTGEDRLSYFSSFGQEGVVKQILYDVGGGGFIKNLPLEKISCATRRFLITFFKTVSLL